MALRQQAQRVNLREREGMDQKEAFLTEAAKLCEEAVELDDTNGQAWHALGNSFLLQFFLKSQQRSDLMVSDLILFRFFIW